LKLKDQVALVTGAGRGIGRAVALAFAREGAAVALAARTTSELEAVAAQIKSRAGRALVVPTDVTREASVGALVEQVLGDFKRVDILVTAAGVATFAPLVDTKTEEWDRMLAVNLRGVFLACRTVLPAMMRQRRGTIINIVSIAAKRAIPGNAAYAASKHAVLGLTQVLAEEMRAHGVRVGALCPGAVDTPIWGGLAAPEVARRMLKPDSIAELVRWLVSSPRGVDFGPIIVLNFNDPWESDT